jgi:Flp pilus assembly protein CpaB
MIKGMTLSNKGSKLTLVLGLTLGLIAAVLTFVYLSGADSGSSGSSSRSSGIGDTPVVVVNRDIPAFTRITADMVVVKNVAASDALLGVFNNAEGVVNQVTVVPMVMGEQVIVSKVSASERAKAEFGDNAPIALLVDDGMRGVSVKISSLIGAGGNIRPGDFVDIILIVETKVANPSDPAAAGSTNTLATTILQNVKVLAIDTEKTAADPSAATNPDTDKEGSDLATTVTLAVTSIQGEVLAMADVCGEAHSGRLALAVRGIGDSNPVTNRSVWPSDGPSPSCAEVLGISSLGQ